MFNKGKGDDCGEARNLYALSGQLWVKDSWAKRLANNYGLVGLSTTGRKNSPEWSYQSNGEMS
jgi:hypothetical protein